MASLESELPRDRTAARVARTLLAETFAGEIAAAELETARLLASELINNAVMHGTGRITLRAQTDADKLRIDVVDDGSGFEHAVRKTTFDDLSGRGLEIVDAEASRWGIFEGTTHVWFELERRGPRLGPA
jgi:anti-sigma regulatory factor (Ser/Thr protein kinase)